MENVKNKKESFKPNVITKIATLLITASFLYYGIITILNQSFYNRTKSGTEISIVGQQATIVGIGLIILGLFPMSFWAKSVKIMANWSLICIILGSSILFFSKALANFI